MAIPQNELRLPVEPPLCTVPRRAAALQPVQARARVTRDALLSAGRSLLADRDLGALSVADIASACGLSVGSFYGRFRDKQSFFALLQEQVTAEWMAGADVAFQHWSLPGRDGAAVVAMLCDAVVRCYRRDAGFFRAALTHASTHPDSWTPIKCTGERFVDGVVVVLSPRLPHLAPARRAQRIRFALQMVFGICVNAVLHDPGPIPLADRQLERELSRAMAMYLGLPPPSGRRRRG